MMHSKNDIVLESVFFGDLTRIDVATDLMCEHYLDMMADADNYEVMEEATSSVFGSISTMVKNTFARIKKFIKEKIEMINRSIQMKKLQDMVSDAERAKLKEIPADAKFQIVDLKVVYKYMDEIEKASSELIKRVNAETEKIKKYDKTDDDRVKKLNDFVVSATKKIDEIYEKIEDNNANLKTVSLSQWIKNAREVLKINDRLYKMETSLDEIGVQLQHGMMATQRAIEEANRMMEEQFRQNQRRFQQQQMQFQQQQFRMMESANDNVDKNKMEHKKSILSGIKNVYQSVTGAMVRFTHKHATAIASILHITSKVGAYQFANGLIDDIDSGSKQKKMLKKHKDRTKDLKLSGELDASSRTMRDVKEKELRSDLRKTRAKTVGKAAGAIGLITAGKTGAKMIEDFGDRPLPKKYQKKK